MMLSLLKHAVQPTIQLRDALNNWPRIARRLAESPRKRRRQLDSLLTARSGAILS